MTNKSATDLLFLSILPIATLGNERQIALWKLCGRPADWYQRRLIQAS